MYVEALVTEIGNFKEAGRRIDTVYMGGGTPSLLRPSQVEQIVAKINTTFTVAPEAEITMELNPGTVTSESLRDYRSLGVNRVSFGVQTFNDHQLKLLARGHNANDARATFELLRRSGFENISFDLIAGLPGQTLRDWEYNLVEAIGLSPQHLSLYLLEIHPGTPLHEQIRTGRRPRPDDDATVEMYKMMLTRLYESGYEQYEISNFSRPGAWSRHNSKYWRLQPVYGFGVSAHSFDGTNRYANERDTPKYLERIRTAGTAVVMNEPADLSSEYIYLGLRMSSGIDLSAYNAYFGRDLAREFSSTIAELTDHGLIVLEDNNLKLTVRGMLLSNTVFAEFV